MYDIFVKYYILEVKHICPEIHQLDLKLTCYIVKKGLLTWGPHAIIFESILYFKILYTLMFRYWHELSHFDLLSVGGQIFKDEIRFG